MNDLLTPQQKTGTPRLSIAANEERLTVRKSIENRLLAFGCLFGLTALVCLPTLGLLSLVLEEHSPHALNAAGAPSPTDYFNPKINHFGFLWLVSALFLFGFAFYFVKRMRRPYLSYDFCRDRNLFLHNDKPLCRLDRVEYIHVHKVIDPDESHSCRLIVVYNDGCTFCLDDAYDEFAMVDVGGRIAEFVGVELVWK